MSFPLLYVSLSYRTWKRLDCAWRIFPFGTPARSPAQGSAFISRALLATNVVVIAGVSGAEQTEAIDVTERDAALPTREILHLSPQPSFTMLFVDKHRPSRLSQLNYHDTLTKRLTSLAADPGGLPHLLLYGPSGAGKKTRVMALLREVFGCGAERLRLEKRTFTTPTKRQVEINMIQSNYHIEMAPGDAGLNDRYVIQDVIKEMAANKNIASVVTSKDGNDGEDDGHAKKKAAKASYKVVVLVEVDKLTRQAQAALRRTMEKYSSSCRLILCCNNPSKVIDPVRSRCLGIRVAAPSDDEVRLRRGPSEDFFHRISSSSDPPNSTRT